MSNVKADPRPEGQLLRRFPLPVPAEAVQLIAVGDLTGDGRLDTVLRHTVEGRLLFTALGHDGEHLWDFDTGLPAKGGWDGSGHHCPFFCWDMDGDGRCEVVLHDAGGTWTEPGKAFYEVGMPAGERMVMLNGPSGEILSKAPWPAWKARVMMTVGHLDGPGAPPSVVVCDETYGMETITVYDGPELRLRWRHHQRRPAGHNVDVADVDGDGRQEILVGGICYRDDGTVAWEAERFGHTDMSKPAKIDPSQPGLQTWYLVEGENPGAYLVGSDGATLWKEPFRHAHFGWIGRQDPGVPGLTPHAAEDGRHEHGAAGAGMRESGHFPLFNPDGSHWLDLSERQRKAYMPVAWLGDGLTDFIDRKEQRVIRLLRDGSEQELAVLPDGVRLGRNLVCYAEGEDRRESIITVNKLTHELVVLRFPESPGPATGIPRESFAYRHDRSQTGSGYYMYCCYHDGWDAGTSGAVQ